MGAITFVPTVKEEPIEVKKEAQGEGDEPEADQGQGRDREITETGPEIEDQEIAGPERGQETGRLRMINFEKGREKDQAIEGERGEEAEIERVVFGASIKFGNVLVAF